MQRKLTKAEFCKLAEMNEDLKRKRKALQEWQEKQDMNAVEQGSLQR